MLFSLCQLYTIFSFITALEYDRKKEKNPHTLAGSLPNYHKTHALKYWLKGIITAMVNEI